MTASRWGRIREILADALELAPSARSGYVDRAAGGDRALAREVADLLVAHGRAGEFLESAPVRALPTLAQGYRLGPYEIVRLLGTGGMGEVYHAHDTRLGRPVALKVLSCRFAEDPAALDRFQTEARVVAALSHPNVLALHDIGQDGGLAYAVMELLEGQTLRERLDLGPLPPEEATRIAVQVAAGLGAAHEKGIVHRDVKPENLLVTREGTVKVLDFGIAKVTSGPAASMAAPTACGVVLGTCAYMSPEQIRGTGVDSRSDVFSLGAVLYEMLSGRRAFTGADPLHVMIGVVTTVPVPLAIPGSAISPALERIVQRCLAKRPEDRFQSMRGVADALRELDPGRVPDAPRRDSKAGRGGLSLGRWPAGVLLAAGVTAGLSTRPHLPAMDPTPSLNVPVTSLHGREFHPAFSPDGHYLAFTWDGGRGETPDLYNKLIGSETVLRLTDDAAVECCPAWSPDGRQLAFIRMGEDGKGPVLAAVSAMGGPARRLRPVRTWFGSALSWSADGQSVFYSDATSGDGPFAVFELDLDTLEARPVTQPPSQAVGDAFPVLSPDGRTIAFARFSGSGGVLLSADLMIAAADGRGARVVHHEPSEVAGLDWTSDGRELVFSSMRVAGARLFRIDVAGGVPRAATNEDDPPMSNTIGAEAVATVSDPFRVSLSRRGHRIAFARSRSDTNIWRVDLDESASKLAVRRLIASTHTDEAPQVSPDGAHVAFSSERGSAAPAIWVCSSEGEGCYQLTNLDGPCGTPRWSPDGGRIAFDAVSPDHGSDIYTIDVETRALKRLTEEWSDDALPSWSSDGRWIYFASDRDGTRQVWKMPAAGGAAHRITRKGGFAAFESADGQTVYYTRFATPGIWQVPPEGGEERRILDAPRCWGYWALGPSGIYDVERHGALGSVLSYYSFLTRRREVLGKLPEAPACGETGLALSPHGDWLAYAGQSRDSDILMIEGFR